MKGYNLPDNVSPNDPEAPWNQTYDDYFIDIKAIIREAEAAVGKKGQTLCWHEQMIGALAWMVGYARQEIADLKKEFEVEDG